jgi:hypothetical protein
MVFPCDYLGSDVELTEEREEHILMNHPDLAPEHRKLIADTLADPDEVRRSARFANAKMFIRLFESLRGGKYVVVIVVSDASFSRNWIITSYMARKLSTGDIEWKKT